MARVRDLRQPLRNLHYIVPVLELLSACCYLANVGLFVSCGVRDKIKNSASLSSMDVVKGD
jgi:hypothetical protein